MFRARIGNFEDPSSENPLDAASSMTCELPSHPVRLGQMHRMNRNVPKGRKTNKRVVEPEVGSLPRVVADEGRRSSLRDKPEAPVSESSSMSGGFTHRFPGGLVAQARQGEPEPETDLYRLCLPILLQCTLDPCFEVVSIRLVERMAAPKNAPGRADEDGFRHEGSDERSCGGSIEITTATLA